MKLRSGTWIGFVAAGLFGLMTGVGMSVNAAKDSRTELPIEDIRSLAQVIEHVKNSYVEEIDDQQLLEDAIEGMLSGLDPHSSYLKAEDFSDLKEDTSGKFGGLGIEVQMDENGYVRVVAPIDETPAARAGILAGDLITFLDGEPVKGLNLTQAVDIMRGEPGDPIELTVVRKGVNKPLKIRIVRDIIKVTSIKSELMEDKYGYIRIRQFQERTGEDMAKALKKLQGEAELDGFILDLRNNPGGVLSASVDVVDALISEGLIVYTEGRVANSESKYYATASNPSNNLPMIVLINGGSASASEIVAGALQDHGRAVIMGTQSFGKGSVQTILPLSEDRAIKLTTARYFTPNGRSIQAQGIVPDIEVERAKLTRQDGFEYYKESDLQGHLDNGNGSEVAGESEQDAADNAESDEDKPLSETDYQLYEALNLLKGIAIAQRLTQSD